MLIGLQVPQGERGDFQALLDQVVYECRDGTENPAYWMFLRCRHAFCEFLPSSC